MVPRAAVKMGMATHTTIRMPATLKKLVVVDLRLKGIVLSMMSTSFVNLFSGNHHYPFLDVCG